MGERSRRVLRGIRSPLDSGSIIGRTSPGRGPAEQLSVAEVLGFIGSSGDVTLAGSFDYLTLSGQEITLNAVDLDTDIAGTLAVASGGTGAQNASDARTNLDVDQAGTDNSTDVTLAGSFDYLTISAQEITLNAVDLDTDISGTLAVASGGTGAQNASDARSNLGLGSAAVEDIGTSGANVGLLNANVTHSGTFTVSGLFTSVGIDDNATSERLEILDSAVGINTVLRMKRIDAVNEGGEFQFQRASDAAVNWIIDDFAGDLRIRAQNSDDLLFQTGGATVLGITTAGVSVTGDHSVSGKTNLGGISELTIASGVVTVTGSHHAIDTESDDATDDLDTINGGADGQILCLRSATSSRDPTLKDNTGNLRLAGDFTLANANQTITLFFTAGNWLEISRSTN